MPGPDATKIPLDASVLTRLTQGVRYLFTGKPPDTFFGPSQPLVPQAQADAQGRAYDYPAAVNTRYIPRLDENVQNVSFWQLRSLANSCDLVRLAVETRKDQMGRLEWLIKPKDLKATPDAGVQQITDFLAFPDREHDWSTWLRMLLEELLVIDAPAVYPRMTRGQGVYSLDLMDGAMFKRLLSLDGRTPIAPDPAYQQIIKGLPAVDYSRDELLYMPRNPRVDRLYGLSPVEQIVMTVNIALRRQLDKLQFYTEGSAPNLMIAVPEDWQPDQIRQMQEYFDALLAGNTAERRKARFIPGGMKPYDVKEGALMDQYDEWLARVVCYAFSLPPNAFIKQVNRATAESAQDVALEEGLAPLMQWVTGFMNQIITRWFKRPDLTFDWQQDAELDQLTQAQIDQIYLQTSVVTPDEVRENLGMDPLTPAQKEELNPPPSPVGADEDGNPVPAGHPNDVMGAKTSKVARARLKKNAAVSVPSTGIATHSPRRVKRFAMRY
jgi:hypothetical protein